MKRRNNNQKKDTSWQKVGSWYANLTKDKGHYFHEHIVIPGLIDLLKLQKHNSLLDLACGSGVLGRAVPGDMKYTGIDIAKSLIDDAKQHDRHPQHQYFVGDITKDLPQPVQNNTHKYTHATCVLALQNVEYFEQVFANAAKYVTENGIFIIVLNHPSFRIPRQTSWGVDEQNKLQYRKVNRYLSPIKIPINMHPGNKEHSPVTWSFHQPLYVYINELHKAGFDVIHMEEWSSDKESEGKFGKMENRAREEIPLFLTLVAKKSK